jgi:RimJ/RimL family protein N-acetyltransferase
MNSTNQIISGYVPGAIGRIAEMHARYYSEHWGFGKFFEAKVATELSEFINRMDDQKDGLWTVCSNERVLGSIVIDGIKADSEGTHLRWYILSQKLKAKGVGGQLIEKAMQFCRSKHYKSVYLWTFKGLDAARHLYEKNGFKLSHEQKGSQWGTTVIEQKYVCEL